MVCCINIAFFVYFLQYIVFQKFFCKSEFHCKILKIELRNNNPQLDISAELKGILLDEYGLNNKDQIIHFLQENDFEIYPRKNGQGNIIVAGLKKTRL